MAVRAIRLNSKEAFKGTHLEIDGQTVTTPKGSVRTVRGCRCKRSRCLKKYCECYGVGLKCGENCICEDCQNGNEFGGPSAVAKKMKSGGKSKAKTKRAPAPASGALTLEKVRREQAAQQQQKQSAKTTHPPVLHKPHFKAQPAAVGPAATKPAADGKPLQSRRPPLSVHIPPRAPEVPPVQRGDLAWGMTPLGNAGKSTPLGSAGAAGWDLRHEMAWQMLDRENSGFAPTPLGGLGSGLQRDREMSGLPLWQSAQWGADGSSARGSMRSPGLGLGPGLCDSPKMGIGPVTPRSPFQPLPPTAGSQAQQDALPSPSVAIFSTAEGMLPQLTRGVSGLSALDHSEVLSFSAGPFGV